MEKFGESVRRVGLGEEDAQGGRKPGGEPRGWRERTCQLSVPLGQEGNQPLALGDQ